MLVMGESGLDPSVVDAQARLDRVIAKHGWGSVEVKAAIVELGEAQRSAAAAIGAPYAVPFDLGIRWDVGAPLPFLIAGFKTFVAFYLPVDFDFDGTNPIVRQPTDEARIGIVEFVDATAARMGPPDDETLAGHALWGHGLQYYDAHVVENSSWLHELLDTTRVHGGSHDSLHGDLKHYLFTFHDESLDCIATDHRVRVETGSLRDVVQHLAAEATE